MAYLSLMKRFWPFESLIKSLDSWSFYYSHNIYSYWRLKQKLLEGFTNSLPLAFKNNWSFDTITVIRAHFSAQEDPVYSVSFLTNLLWLWKFLWWSRTHRYPCCCFTNCNSSGCSAAPTCYPSASTSWASSKELVPSSHQAESNLSRFAHLYDSMLPERHL